MRKWFLIALSLLAGGAAVARGQTLEVTPDDCRAHHLMPVSISIQVPAPLRATTFPDKAIYVSLSGPPGGPLGCLISRYESSESAERVLEQQAQARARLLGQATVGEKETITVAGVKRPARAVLGGSGPTRSLACLFLIPHPQGGQGLLVTAYVSGIGVQANGCAPVVTDRVLSSALNSLGVAW